MPFASVIAVMIVLKATKLNVTATPGTPFAESSTTRARIGVPGLDGSLVIERSLTDSMFLAGPAPSAIGADAVSAPAVNVRDAAPLLPRMVNPGNVARPLASV